MSLATLRAAITIDAAFSAADQAAILAAMETIYRGSGQARAMIDGWIATPGKRIKFTTTPDLNAYGRLNQGEVILNLAVIPMLNYITPTGKASQFDLVHILVHELGHALTGRDDSALDRRNNGGFLIDYKGDNVKYTNPMLTELGIPERLSYIAATLDTSLGGILERNFEYTNGASIDRAQSGDRDWSMSLLTFNSRDLLIGGPSANILQAGFGDDFLWGMGGDDQLYGGFGIDTVGYKGKPTDYDTRLNPDGSWAVRHVRGAKNEGSDTVINAEKILFQGGATFDLKKKGLTYQSDFALVIDTTGSMGDDIDSVKRQGTAIINALFQDDSKDARIGIVSFKDNTYGEPTSVLLNFTDHDQFADRKSAALSALNRVSVGGGGDLPETAFDGLLKALNGSMGNWRPGAGTHRVVLFTDASAKDSALLPQIRNLASNIGADITPGLRAVGSSGILESLTLKPRISNPLPTSSIYPGSGDDDPELPPFKFIEELPTKDLSSANLEIYTIYTGNFGTIDPSLRQIADETGGQAFSAPNPDDLVKTLLSIIELPPDIPKYRLSCSSTEIWEGDRLSIGLATTNVASKSPIYWSLTGSGITASDFTDRSSTGTGVIGADGRYSFSKILAVDPLSDPNETLDVKFFTDPDRKNQVGATLSVLIKEQTAGIPTDGSDVIRGTINSVSSREIIKGVPLGSVQRGRQSIDILTGLDGPDTFVLGDELGIFYDDGIASNKGSTDLAVILDFNAGDLIQLHGSSSQYSLSRGAYTTAGFANMQGLYINRTSPGSLVEIIGFVNGVSLATLSLQNTSQFIYSNLPS